jgi:hypothetical protein
VQEMKKSLITTLVAVPVLSLSSVAFAAEPMLLSSVQMDGVTAGQYDTASIFQLNVSPVTLAQLNVLTVGGGNMADINSGNVGVISQ